MVTRENGDYISIGRTKSHCGYSDAYSVIVIPADPASREAMVERMAKAIQKAWRDGDGYVNSWDEAEAALASICPKGAKAAAGIKAGK